MGLLLAYFYEHDQDAARYAYYGVMGLRHRGRRASYAVLAPDGSLATGSVDPWSDSWSLEGRGYAAAAAIGPGTSSATASSGGVRAVAFIDGPCPARELASLAASRDLGDVAEEVVSGERYAACSAVVLRSDGGFLAARGRESPRPLAVGGYGFEALYAATETAPMTLMGGSPRHFLSAGEAVYGDRYLLERAGGGGRRRTCLFEYIYLARPDSLVDGVNVYAFRREMGARLAEVHGVDVDVVAGVPETAIPYAIGYAERSGARFEYGFVSTLGRVRTAIAGLGQEERLMMLSLKLNPVPGVFEDKSVAVIDDSVVTGLTLKTVIQRLRRLYGAREVHVAVSSPKIVEECPLRVQLVTRETLIARHLSDDELAKVLDADSLAWLPLGYASSYLERHGVTPCYECMR